MRFGKIGVIGVGFVGKAMARAFMEHAEIRTYDVIPELATHTFEQVMECEWVFICLPTPMKENGECDLGYLREFCERVKGSNTCIVLKSTVPVGTTEAFAKEYNLQNLLHSPEFLTARCALVDAQLPARNIIGYTPTSRNRAVLFQCLLFSRYPGTPVFDMPSNCSELVKLMCNNFFAVKVAFFNEMFALVKAMMPSHDTMAVWNQVIPAILSDGRIAHAHTNVPGPDGKFGFGGTCLPKDLMDSIHLLKSHGVDPMVLQGAWDRNVAVRGCEATN